MVVPNPVFGEFRIGVFVKLTNSDLNSTLNRSVMLKNFARLRSRVCNPGPRTVPTPQVPNAPVAAGPKTLDEASNHWYPPNGEFCVPKTDVGERQSGRAPRELVPEASGPEVVRAKPVCRLRMALTCQSPATALTTGFMLLPNWRSRPKGMSYVA